MISRRLASLFQDMRLALQITISLVVSTFLLSVANIWLEQLAKEYGVIELTRFWLFAGLVGIVLVTFMVLVFKLPGFKRRFGATAEVLGQADLPKRPYLITGISAFAAGPQKDPGKIDLAPWSPANLSEAINTDAGRAVFGNWQQNLRVIWACPGVQHVYVLENDLDQFPRFAEVMKHFFPDIAFHRIQDRKPRPGAFRLSTRKERDMKPDYEKFDYVAGGIDRALQMIAEEHKLPIHEAEAGCFLDATSGKKTLSIISSIASVNRPLLFVYCSAEPHPDRPPGYWEVIAYDISIQVREDRTA